jgi:hypothetical protein
MAIENIKIDSGTGPAVAIDQVGTDCYQIVKVVQAGDGSAGTLGNVFTVTEAGTVPISVASLPAISGSVSVINTPVVTATVTVMPVLSASNVTVASLAAITPFQVGGGVIASGTGTGPLIMGIQSGATLSKPVLVHTTGGLIIAAMPAVGGGQQYPTGDTSMGATATGTVIMGMQSGATTGRAVAITTTGGLVIGSMPAVGGGQQYSAGATDMGATATGMVLIGVQSGATTGRALLVSTTGGLIVDAYTISNIGTVSTVLAMPVLSATGVTIANVTALTPFVAGGGVIASGTGTGPVIMGMQSGATLAKPIAVTTTGAQYVTNLGNENVNLAKIMAQDIAVSGGPSTVGCLRVELANDGTGAMRIVSTVSTLGTIVNAVTVTASANPIRVVVNAITGTETVSLAATTAVAGAFVGTAHASAWNASIVVTDSSNTIVKTSGAHTIYVTDLMVSVDVPMTVRIFSAATFKLSVYLATKGGFVFPMATPMMLNTAQSLTITPAVSGSCCCYAAGYTVT